MIEVVGEKQTTPIFKKVFVNVTVGTVTYKWVVGNVSINLTGNNLQSFLDENEEVSLSNIRRNEYPQADLSETSAATELEKWTAWIAAGCNNPDGTVIEKVPFPGNHNALYDRPLNTREISQASRDAYKAATGDSEKLAIFEKIVFGKSGA